VESVAAGFVTGIDAAEIGRAVASIGGGRVRMEDMIDPAVGFLAGAKIGDEVRDGDTLGLLLCRGDSIADQAAGRIRAAYIIGDERPNAHALIKEVVT
ncbi:MAG: hypothetical protein WCD76_17130, partial [Pyrinomonadaceae bacterium]